MLVDDLIRELKKHRTNHNINVRYTALEDGSIVDLGPLDVKIDVFEVRDGVVTYAGLDPEIKMSYDTFSLILEGFRDAGS